MFLVSKKKGFTLIELLVVIAIIVILSVLAVGGYSQFRKATLLNLAADSFIAQVFEQRSETLYGERERAGFEAVKVRLEGAEAVSEHVGLGKIDSSGALCRGVYLEKSEQGFVARTYSQPFIDKKTFDRLRGWIYQGCGEFKAADFAGSFKDFELDRNIKIIKVAGAEGSVLREIDDDLIIRFIPPFGLIEVSLDGGRTFVSDFGAADFNKLNIEMQYGLAENDEFKRTIVFDLINQNAVNK